MRAFPVLAASALALPLHLSPAAAADYASVWHLVEQAETARQFVVALLSAAYSQQPALVLALSTLLAVPALAAVSLVAQSTLRAFIWRRRQRHRPAKSEILIRDPRPKTGIPAWPAQAWLRKDEDGSAVPIAAELVSIGRHEDNVVHLGDTSVHRFHAIIHRSDDAHFIITDVSGEDGNGVRVNGERLLHARLIDGDRIELGRARLTFAAVPH